MPVVLQAGAIAVRFNKGEAQVLIVRAKRNPQDWIFPKGHIEAGESAAEAAARELLEEGGVIGTPADLIGVSQFHLGERRVEVSYFLVWYEEDGVAHEHREKRWLRLNEARALVSFDDARGYLDAVESLLKRSR